MPAKFSMLESRLTATDKELVLLACESKICHGVHAGLKAVLTLSSTQRFGEAGSATVTGTYSHREGVGLQVR